MKKDSFYGKWLWILFWLLVPGIIASLMISDMVLQAYSGLYLPGKILEIVSSAAYGFILLKIGSDCYFYRTSGICTLLGVAFSVASELLMSADAASLGANFGLLFTLPGLIIGLVGEYNEYKGHETILSNVDRELSERWGKIWKWYLGSIVAVLGGSLLVTIAGALGALVALAGSAAMSVVSIMKWVYLYRTAATFRDRAR